MAKTCILSTGAFVRVRPTGGFVLGYLTISLNFQWELGCTGLCVFRLAAARMGNHRWTQCG